MENNRLNIALIQANLAWEDISLNTTRFSDKFKEVEGEQHIILLPELFTTGFTMNAMRFAEKMDGRTVDWLRHAAVRFKFAIGGSIIIEEDGKFFNRFVFVTPSGDVYHYDKRHLFRMGNENSVYTFGTKRVIVNYLGWRVLLTTCYDLRFPVWSRNRNDYDLLVNVANFPEARREVWSSLLKARAIENQCYVAAVNCVGTDGMGINYSGDSQIINPKGQVVALGKEYRTQIIYQTISMDELVEFRQKFPVHLDADDFSIST